MGRVIGHLKLDAWPGRVGVAAAERDSINQVFSIHITFNPAALKNVKVK